MKRILLASLIALAAGPTLAARHAPSTPIDAARYKGQITCYAEYWKADYDADNHPISMPERLDKMPDGAVITFDGDKGSVYLYSDFDGARDEVTYQLTRGNSPVIGGFWALDGQDATLTRDPSEPNAFLIKPNNEPRSYEQPRGEFHLNSCYRSGK